MLSEFKFLPSWENVPKFVQLLFSRTTDIPIKTSVHTYIKTVVSLLWLRFCLSYQNLLPYRSRWVSREKYSVSYSVIICLMLLPECFRRLRITRSCRTVKIHVGQFKAQTARRAAKYDVLCQCRETERDRRAEDTRGTVWKRGTGYRELKRLWEGRSWLTGESPLLEIQGGKYS